jgi:hypothetical protein
VSGELILHLIRCYIGAAPQTAVPATRVPVNNDRKQAYAVCLRDVVIGLAGDSLTTEQLATKEASTVLYGQIKDWLYGTDFEGGRQPPDRTRFHTELHEVFEKRKQLLTEWFLIEEPDDEVMKSLRAHFPYNRPSAALIKSVFLNFSKLKTDSRNVFGPSYNAVLKERKQGYQSGDYDDSEQLLDLLEKHICARVDSNFQKSVSDGVVDYKKKLQEQGQTATAKMISDEKKTLIQNKTAYYNQKKAGWHNSVVHTCPGSFLCFLLLGAPGKNLHLSILVE